MYKHLLTSITLTSMLVGCATISGSGTTQPLSVVALASDGSEVEGVKCDMSNDEGTWYVNTPGSTTVRA
jgi:hypothetical protein